MKYKVNKKQNVSSSCIVCGIHNKLGLKTSFYEMENGELVAICKTGRWHQSYPGRTHGGIIAALLDETIGRAASMKDDQVWAVTASFEIKYKKPVPLNETLKIVGRITKENRKLFEGTGEIILENGEIAATAHGKYMRTTIDQFEDANLDREWIVDDRQDGIDYIDLD